MVKNRLERKTNLMFALGWDMWSDHHHRKRIRILKFNTFTAIHNAGISRIANDEIKLCKWMVCVCACQLKWKCNKLFLEEEKWYWLCEGGLSAWCCCLVELRSNTDLETTRCLPSCLSVDVYTSSLAACIRVAETV